MEYDTFKRLAEDVVPVPPTATEVSVCVPVCVCVCVWVPDLRCPCERSARNVCR